MSSHKTGFPFQSERRRRYEAIALAGILLTSLSCRDSTSLTSVSADGRPTSAPSFASVAIDRPSAELAPGEAVTFHATVSTATGSVPNPAVDWSVADTTVGAIGSDGVFRAHRMGVTQVYARAQEVQDSASVRVGERLCVAGGVLESPGGSAQLTIPEGALSGEALLTIIPRQVDVPGPTLSGTTFDLLPEGTIFSQPVQLQLRYRSGDVDAGTLPSRLAVGELTSSGWEPLPGSAADTTATTVTASIQHFSTYAVLALAAVASVEVVPDQVSLMVGDSETVYATTWDANHNALERPATWATSDSTVATVTSDGTITGVSEGTVDIMATSEGVSGASHVTVGPLVPVASVEISTASLSLTVGQSAQLAATVRDAQGNVLQQPIAWQSSNATVATVDATGRVTGLQPGSAVAIALSGGARDSAIVSVVRDVQPLGIPGQWSLAFQDEFDGHALNSANWNRQLDWSPIPINGQLQYYDPAPDSAVTVRNGTLELTATARPQGGFEYTSGTVASQGKVTFLYGVIEARLRVPKGAGMWPAFWLMPADLSWPPEIDVAEFNGGQASRVYLAAHWGSEDNMSHFSRQYDGPDFTSTFHTYAIDWEPGVISWYVDGILEARWQDDGDVPSGPMYVILNLAVGGSFVGDPQPEALPGAMEVDYVRIWRASSS